MVYKRLFYLLLFAIFCAGAYYFFDRYRASGAYIDDTFSNVAATNKQFPSALGGFCFGGTDLLSAKVIHETPSSLLFEVTYCNTEILDGAVLGVSALRDDEYVYNFAFTPGGTVIGHGRGYVKLSASNLPKPMEQFEYSLMLYGNNSGAEFVSYPFRYQKVWCTAEICDE